jgi:putative transposase
MDGKEANEAAITRSHEAHGPPISIHQVQDLHNLVEQDHRAVKRVTRPRLGFTSFHAAQAPLAGGELMHRLRKRQIRLEAGEKGLTPAAQFYALASSSSLTGFTPLPASTHENSRQSRPFVNT